MKLHIHFGIHRTGTTSIHSTLVNNLRQLDKQGFLYPELGVDYRHVRTAWQLIGKKIDGTELVRRIKKEIKPTTVKVIISSEDFSLLKDSTWLAELSSNFDLSASVYLRRQDLWLESWYNQHIKWPWDKRFSNSTPEFFLSKKEEFYWLDYSWLLSEIENFIKKENIYTQVMERSSVSDTTVDFLRSVGIDISLVDIKNPKNASLTKCQLDILRRVDLSGANAKQRNEIISALRTLDIAECNGSKVIFHTGQRKEILSQYSATNEKVADKYFKRTDLFLDSVEYFPVNILDKEKIYKKYLPQLIKSLAHEI